MCHPYIRMIPVLDLVSCLEAVLSMHEDDAPLLADLLPCEFDLQFSLLSYSIKKEVQEEIQMSLLLFSQENI